MVARYNHLALFTVIIIGLAVKTASAQPVTSKQADLGLQVFLVEDKTIAGADFSFAFPNFGIHTSFSIITADDDAPRHNVDNEWVGSLLGFHLFGRIPFTPTMEARIGTGLDSWLLHGVAPGENKHAWPAYGELRFMPSPKTAAYLRGRYYIVSSDGLGVGEDYQGRQHKEILFSAGVSYVF
ncbi:MAG: hypothetical protein CMH52_01470 [Myxococcales bacterium]|nr:hypothetical protein [Myxococcales bacterium]